MPAGFGGTLPVPSSTAVVVSTTVPSPVLTASPTTVATSTTLSSSTEALKARALEYDRVELEESLDLPEPDFERLLSYWLPGATKEIQFASFLEDIADGRTFALNKPNIYFAAIVDVIIEDQRSAAIVVCSENNLVEMAAGPDRRTQTEDDAPVDPSTGATRYTQHWIFEEDEWLLNSISSLTRLPKGISCGAR